MAEEVLQHLAKILMPVCLAGGGAMDGLVNNEVGLSILTLLSEVLSVGVKTGIDHQTLLTVMQNGAYGPGLFLIHILPNIALTMPTSQRDFH